MEKTLNQTWDLDSIFKGGSHSEQFKHHLEQLKKQLSELYTSLQTKKAPQSSDEASDLSLNIKKLQRVSMDLSEAASFVGCLMAQDVKDEKAVQLETEINSLNAQSESCQTLLFNQMEQIPQEVWKKILQDKYLGDIEFFLNEKRDMAKEKLSIAEEQLINSLSIDGYHGWGSFYDTIVGNISIPFDHPEKGEQTVSVGQLDNYMSDENREVRKAAFNAYEKAWKEVADYCGKTLNHLAGFRLHMYKARKWENVLKEPLDYNRMSEKTLNTMWDVISKNKGIFGDFLKRKAKLLNIDQLSWYDMDAPVGISGSKVTYEESCNFIIKHFNKFNPKMADFAKQAIENRWIEAEDRAGKRPGGFCTSFPNKEESRIFMTFSGTPNNTSTLAHELGHAYHQHVMNDLPYFATDYAMNVAETASTFAEMIVGDAALEEADSKEERIAFLDDKIQRSVALLMNIHARFLFETRFYEERKNGYVSNDRLNELMVEAQKEGYGDALDVYHPSFWESKLHFYISDVPFYNFPYTFGFLFSTGIYVRALDEGKSFADKYDALLRDTGSMTVEDLALKHLNVDLTRPEFWEEAVAYCVKDVEEFLDLTAE